MNRQTAIQTRQQKLTATPTASGLLQRKCACGNHTMAGGECEECAKKKTGLQRKLAIGANNDPLEQEADRVADQIVANRTASSSVSSLTFGRLQREDAPKEKTNEEKYKEGLEKLGEAFLKTPLGKELLEKIKQDTLVKGVTEFGKDFISTWPGKIVTGAAATGTVAALAATHKELPAQIPEIPLDILTPSLSVQLTYKGPVDKPTEAMITFKFTEQAPKGSADKKPMSETDKFRAETARLAAEDAKFRAGMTYKPGPPEDLQQKAEQAAIRKAALKYSGGPDIEATIKKYPWLATPQPKSELQLTMPKPSFGIQTPSLLGDEFKLKLPIEQKKKEDEPGLQRKLTIGASNDPLEHEADLIADHVMATPAPHAVRGTPPRIQRFSGQSTGQMDAAPASVDQALASPGRPLEPALRQDMERRFGYDFSGVRVHSSAAAEQSARDVNAHAYTVGQDIIFGVGRFAPGTHEGRRLIAHELTHVVQQSGSDGMRVGQSNEKRSLSPITRLAIQCDLARPEPNPGAVTGLLTPDQVRTAIRFNEANFSDPYVFAVIRDVLGVSRFPAVADDEFVQAIAGWQARNNLPQNGRLTAQTTATIVAELRAEGALVPALLQDAVRVELEAAFTFNAQQNFNRRTIIIFQALVGAPSTGIWDDATIQRLMVWQGAHGLGVDGKVGPGTLRSLIEELVASSLFDDAIHVIVNAHHFPTANLAAITFDATVVGMDAVTAGTIATGQPQTVRVGPSTFTAGYAHMIRIIGHELQHVQQRSGATPIANQHVREFLAFAWEALSAGAPVLAAADRVNHANIAIQHWNAAPVADRTPHQAVRDRLDALIAAGGVGIF